MLFAVQPLSIPLDLDKDVPGPYEKEGMVSLGKRVD